MDTHSLLTLIRQFIEPKPEEIAFLEAVLIPMQPIIGRSDENTEK